MSLPDPTLPPISILELPQRHYRLRPGMAEQAHVHFEQRQHYGALNAISQKIFKREAARIETDLCQQHRTCIRHLLPAGLCQTLIQEFERDPVGIQSPHVLKAILPHVFTHAVDQQLISYFGSEYCIFWWSIYAVDAGMEQDAYFTRWHADSGPDQHLKVIIYLNSSHDHGSDTAFLSLGTSQALKEVGYLFNDLADRVPDVTELCQYLGVDASESRLQANTGDCLIFNPNQLAHKAIVPTTADRRYALNFSIVPAPFDYRTMLEDYWPAAYDCQPFSGFAEQLLQRLGVTSPSDTSAGTIMVGQLHQLTSVSHVRWLCQHIFAGSALATELSEQLLAADPTLSQCNSIFNFLRYCRQALCQRLEHAPSLDLTVLHALTQLAAYEQQFQQSVQCYNPRQGQSVSSIFWPNPTDPRHPKTKYQLLPYVNSVPLVSRQTKIGSAGSCFAVEIAKVLQQQGFAYVVTEANDDVNNGVMLDTPITEPELARFSAAYGLLFNSPSFCQLAERAFGVRSFEPLLIDADGCYVDPYREGVRFKDAHAYLANAPKHLAAVREALTQCEVFIITLGLNECWQLLDGSFISRNPRANMYHMVQHRVLTVDENIDYIQRFYDLVKAHNPAFKLIISVSPVPLMATGRHSEQHIISANCHSKSVLRVAADALVQRNADMYYLPSYELVTECSESPWQDDYRHVTAETVARVIEMFAEMFVITD